MRLNVTGLALAALAVVSTAHATPFQNGSFELPGGNEQTFYSTSTAITGWTLTSGSVDYVKGYWQPADGAYSLDLSGTSPGSIAQTFDTVAGHSYKVSFAMAGNPDSGPTVKTLQVQATGGALTQYSFDTSGKTKANMQWSTQTYQFTATGAATTLTFTSSVNTPYGPTLDNVVVTDVTPAPVPTLSPWALAGLVSLLGMFAVRRRRLAVR